MYLTEHLVLKSNNLDQLRYLLSDLLNPHVLTVTDRAKEVDASVAAVSISEIGLIHNIFGEDVPIEIKAEENQDEEAFMINVPTSGSGVVLQGKKEIELNHQQAGIVNSQDEFHGCYDGFSTLILKIPKRLILDKLNVIFGETINEEKFDFHSTLDLGTALGQHFRKTLTYFAHELNNPFNISMPEGLKSEIESLLVTQVLHSFQHSFSERLQSPERSKIVPYHVKRAREYIHEFKHGNPSLDEITAYAGCGARTLQLAFQNNLGMSPMAYLKALKLRKVRQDLLEALSGEKVKDIALRNGFGHLGNFSQIYKQKYGVTPFETLKYKR